MSYEIINYAIRFSKSIQQDFPFMAPNSLWIRHKDYCWHNVFSKMCKNQSQELCIICLREKWKNEQQFRQMYNLLLHLVDLWRYQNPSHILEGKSVTHTLTETLNFDQCPRKGEKYEVIFCVWNFQFRCNRKKWTTVPRLNRTSQTFPFIHFAKEHSTPSCCRHDYPDFYHCKILAKW